MTKFSRSTWYPTLILEENPNLMPVWWYLACSTCYNRISKNSQQIMCTKWSCSIWYQGLILKQIQDLKSFFPYLVRITWYSQYTHSTKNSHKINLSKSDHLKWYQDRFFKGNPYLVSEISNYITSTRYSYIYFLATFWKTLTFTNHDDLYIILTQFSRRFQIWSQKFQILSVAFIFGKLLF
jgi:hypothetical protein